MTRFSSDVYGRILDDHVLIRWNGGVEDELGYLSALSHGILRHAPQGAPRRARMQELAEQWRNFLGLSPEEEALPSPRGVALQDLAGRLRSNGRALLHEGFSIDPHLEGAAGVADLMHRCEVSGQEFLTTPPSVWSAWAEKTTFRPRCRELLGEDALPPGKELAPSDVEVVVGAAQRVRRQHGGTVIVKGPGVGGAGNIVVSPEADLRARLDSAHWDWPGTAVSVEAWLEWEASYCVSYFLPGHGPVRPVAVARQLIDRQHGKFVGSSSDLELSWAELQHSLAMLRPLFEAMRADGVRGVAAVDVIVAAPGAWGRLGLELPGGRRLCLIECNPRMNGHNRVGLIVERVARRWGVAVQEIGWQLRGQTPPPGSTAIRLARCIQAYLAERGHPVTAARSGNSQHFQVILDKAERVSTLILQLRPVQKPTVAVA